LPRLGAAPIIALRGLDMPWNETYFPRSMAHLAAPVRAKAIEIANALLEDGYDEGRAIRIAIAQAKRWARAHLSGFTEDEPAE
jgi:uncharacterized protein YdaT